MQIKQENKVTKGRLVALKNEKELGEMTYSIANDGEVLIVDHTGVFEDHQEKGVGKAMYSELVSIARQENKKIIPLCPFVKAQFKKNEDDWDVLKDGKL